MNRLADETSPYLRQHADNPVDWQPWDALAFEEAKRRDVPILLSIGYASCHWCHVMAHESFEDQAVAQIVNEYFVAIKVDREQRPDIDAVYMEATHAMTGSGGWPMTVFMTPEAEPFFCGTYFPPQPSHGRASFNQVCEAITEAWRTRRSEVTEQAEHLTAHLQQTPTLGTRTRIDDRMAIDAAIAGAVGLHDPTNGGFGHAPKFPQPSTIDLLLRAAARGDETAQQIAEFSLDSMAAGGIFDHLGGGFSRYSVDAQWLVPHFEKMLYDQALLIRLYLHSWQMNGPQAHRQILEETVEYVLRDLTDPSGGFYSSEDADSEGVEGKFYAWSRDEIIAALGAELGDEACDYWDVTAEGNFEGSNVLNRLHARRELERDEYFSAARRRLFELREKRVRPGLDDKVLTEWNGLMLASLAEAAAATGNPEWLAAAERNAEFLTANLQVSGRWMRSWQPSESGAGKASQLALAADYAAIIDGFTRLAEASGKARWIEQAKDAANQLLELFSDPQGAGFFTTASDGEQLIARPKDIQDGAIPAANSNAAWALVRLGALTGDKRYSDAAEEVVAMLEAMLSEHPLAFSHLAAAAEIVADGAVEVVVVGDRPDLVRTAHRVWNPNAVLAWGEVYDSPLWEGRTDAQAYVCRDFVCHTPLDDALSLSRALQA